MLPWTRHYDPGVPESLAPYPDKTLVDYVRANAAARPDAAAIFFKGLTVSNSELDRLSDRFASALVSYGVRRGDRIALVLPNSPQFLIAEIGAWKAGATVLPLNPLYTAAELTEPLRSAGVKLVVTLTPFYERLKEIQPQTPVTRIIATNIKEFLPPVLRLLFTLAKEKKGGHRIALQAGDVWFKDALATAVTPLSAPAPEDAAIMLMSGGTTGTPKAVVGLAPGGETSHSSRSRCFMSTPASVRRATRFSEACRWRWWPTRAISMTCSRRLSR
jgi:long-chain acyl-CoA synthetase